MPVSPHLCILFVLWCLPKWNSHKMSPCLPCLWPVPSQNVWRWYQKQIFLSQFDPQHWHPSMNREKLKLSQLLWSFLMFINPQKFTFMSVLPFLFLEWTVWTYQTFWRLSVDNNISWRGFMPMAQLLPFNCKIDKKFMNVVQFLKKK